MVRIDDERYQIFGPRELGPDERWDLGTIEVGGAGSLRVRFIRAPGAPASQPRLAIEYGGQGSYTEFRYEGDGARASKLSPGSYSLRVGEFDGFACAMHPFEVRADEETVLDVELSAGSARTIRIELAQDDPEVRYVAFSIERTDGVRVLSTYFGRETEPTWERELVFSPGSYRAKASIEDGRSSSASFVVDSPETNPPPVVLRIE
jgi:hypothetical protein